MTMIEAGSPVPLTDQEAVQLGTRLLGRPVRAVPILGGGNNRVYRLEDGASLYALKIYPRQETDLRDRLGQEYGALEFLARQGIGGVPYPVVIDRAANSAIYRWIDGMPVKRIDDADIDALADFMIRLLPLRLAATSLPPASASCFSAGMALAQLDARTSRLRQVAGDFPDLLDFLDHAFMPATDGLRRRCLQIYSEAGIDPTGLLPIADRILSPSDFGFHNALRVSNGLAFTDFEYFGWDDPAKAICDIALHPGSALPEQQARRFVERTAPLMAEDISFLFTRIRALYPIFASIWCLIILNEFLPECLTRRLLAGGATAPSDVHTRREHQLRIARKRLDNLLESHDCPILPS